MIEIASVSVCTLDVKLWRWASRQKYKLLSSSTNTQQQLLRYWILVGDIFFHGSQANSCLGCCCCCCFWCFLLLYANNISKPCNKNTIRTEVSLWRTHLTNEMRANAAMCDQSKFTLIWHKSNHDALEHNATFKFFLLSTRAIAQNSHNSNVYTARRYAMYLRRSFPPVSHHTDQFHSDYLAYPIVIV